MAETATNDAAQRYAVIEQAYSKEDWATVLRDGEELLLQLGQTGNSQLLGLRMRLQLLLGHTQLYGLADKAAAAKYYSAVATQSGEAALAKIAEQGLNQCSAVEPPAPTAEPEPEPEEQPPASPTPEPEQSATATVTTEAAAPATPFTDPAPTWLGTPAPEAGANTAPAAPWLAAMATATTTTSSPEPTPAPTPTTAAVAPAGPTLPVAAEAPAAPEPAAPGREESLIPEVVEEPELIELHQADPALAEEVELTWQETATPPAGGSAEISKDDQELLRGLMLVRIG
jgi:hypothetical protein